MKYRPICGRCLSWEKPALCWLDPDNPEVKLIDDKICDRFIDEPMSRFAEAAERLCLILTVAMSDPDGRAELDRLDNPPPVGHKTDSDDTA